MRTHPEQKKIAAFREVFLFMKGIYSCQIIAHPFLAAVSTHFYHTHSLRREAYPFLTDPPLVLPNS